MSDHHILQALRLNYLYAEKFNFPKDWKYFEADIPYSMIRFIHKGCATFIIDENLYELEENDIIYIPQGSTLSCEATTDDFSFMSIRFTAAFPLIDSEIWSEIFGVDAKIRCDDPQVKLYFYSIIREKDSAKRGRNFMLRGYLELIVGYVINSSEALETRSSKPRRMKSDSTNDNRVEIVLAYMLNNYHMNMSIEEMSRMVNLSSSSLRRLFKLHTGKSPSEFLTELKMVVAAKRILETDERISDIAYTVGIEDPNYFSRIFKKHFGALQPAS